MSLADVIHRAPKALLHDHLDGGLRPQTVVELAQEFGYKDLPTTDVDDLATWFNRGAKRNDLVLYLETFAHTVGVMQHRDAIERVAYECAEDLAADGSCTPRSASPPSSHREGLDARRGDGGGARRVPPRRGRHRPDDLLDRVTAMRTAARSLEIAELAVRFRDAGVVGFDIAGAEAGYPPTRHLDAFQYVNRRTSTPPSTPARRSGCRRSGRRAVLRRRAARPRCAHRRRHRPRPGARHREAGPAGDLHPRPAHPARAVPDVERQHRCRSVDRRSPDRDAAAAAVPRHGQHRQPADEQHVDDQGDAEAPRGVRVGPRRLRVAHGERDEVGVRPTRCSVRTSSASAGC
jgi:hypothetical protein